MRKKYRDGKYTQAELAKITGLSVGQVGRIVRGEVWKDVEYVPSRKDILRMQRNFAQGYTQEVFSMEADRFPHEFTEEEIANLRKAANEERAKREAREAEIDPLDQIFKRNPKDEPPK